jgi:hypothetical protein
METSTTGTATLRLSMHVAATFTEAQWDAVFDAISEAGVEIEDEMEDRRENAIVLTITGGELLAGGVYSIGVRKVGGEWLASIHLDRAPTA